MIVFNTTFHIDRDILSESLAFLKSDYIPKVLAGRRLTNPSMRRILHDNQEEGESLAIQFHVENMDVLQRWLEEEGIAIKSELVARFQQRMIGFSTIMEELDI